MAASPPPPIASTAELISDGSGITQVLDAGAATAAPDQVYSTSTPLGTQDPLAFLHVVPDGYRVVTTDVEQIRERYRLWPARKTGAVTVSTFVSFLTYVDKHTPPTTIEEPDLDGTEDSSDTTTEPRGEQVEITVHNNRIVGVLNAPSPDMPGWSDHTITLQLRHSPEWETWVGDQGRRLMPQAEFAEWLEDQADDVADPDKATLIEVARSLEAHTKSNFKSRYRTKDGQIGLRYEEDTQARAGANGDVEIPDHFELRLRVFLGQDPVRVMARLRFRVSSTGLALGYVIHRPGDLVRAEVEAIADSIAENVPPGALVLDART